MHIHRQLREDGLCILTFRSAGFPGEYLRPRHAGGTRRPRQLRIGAAGALAREGLVLLSRKPSIFIAGADLRSLPVDEPEELEEFIALGQNVFAALAALPHPDGRGHPRRLRRRRPGVRARLRLARGHG